MNDSGKLMFLRQARSRSSRTSDRICFSILTDCIRSFSNDVDSRSSTGRRKSNRFFFFLRISVDCWIHNGLTVFRKSLLCGSTRSFSWESLNIMYSEYRINSRHRSKRRNSWIQNLERNTVSELWKEVSFNFNERFAYRFRGEKIKKILRRWPWNSFRRAAHTWFEF